MTEYLFFWEFDQMLLLLKPLTNNYLLQPATKRKFNISYTESTRDKLLVKRLPGLTFEIIVLYILVKKK